MRELCVLRALWYRLRYPFTVAPISGHAWVESETCEHARVQVLRCRSCGKTDVGWSPAPAQEKSQ